MPIKVKLQLSIITMYMLTNTLYEREKKEEIPLSVSH